MVKIVLTTKDFSTLVLGQEVVKDEVHIILDDIGFYTMQLCLNHAENALAHLEVTQQERDSMAKRYGYKRD